MSDYELNQVFTGMYPIEAAEFCNNSGLYHIEEIEALEDGTRQFQIVENPTPTEEEIAERINNLSMTALDFITGLKMFGLSLETINSYLEANLELKMQLTYCNNVYCYVVKQLCPLTVGDFTLTEKITEAMFKYKAGEISLDELTALISTETTEEESSEDTEE
ncbi:MAG: hypothetical protein LUH05_08605 [Candidatus Gastranaerophilales bacterium]|nr:hypothetical protein [Candidatus Gastranaerophilales bacterium]